MPKCPSVPWIGMTEKRKYGVIEVIPGPRNIRKNPVTDITLKERMGGMITIGFTHYENKHAKNKEANRKDTGQVGNR